MMTACATAKPASLPIGKLRGVTLSLRARLKQRGITRTEHLLAHVSTPQARERLAGLLDIGVADLERLVHRADLARINGVGAVFGDMLEVLGLDTTAHLAEQETGQLHEALFELNRRERWARRSPTYEEVGDWIRQAKALHDVDS